MSQHKIVIGHPFMAHGGSEARAMWLLQILKDDFEVTLVTSRNVDLDDLNRFYGTSICANQIKIRIAPTPFLSNSRSSIAALRGAFYSRFTKQIGCEYDLCISSYNVSDWGIPSIHFIADFVWDRELANRFDPVPKKGAKFIHQKSVIRKLYLSVCRFIEGEPRSMESFFDGSETIISNSFWTAGVIEKKYKYVCDGNVYPEVRSDFREVPWIDKTSSFVSIGRIAPEKRIEQQIKILEKVRELGHDIHFHLIGGIGDDPYGRMIRRLCAGKDWIELHGQKIGADKEALLTGSRFAIHTRPYEAFGISVAELVKAGCIPFIPNTGGQTEIVPFEELQFGSVEEAIQKIDATLRDEAAQQLFLKKLADQKDKFSTVQFCTQARKIVHDWFLKYS